MLPKKINRAAKNRTIYLKAPPYDQVIEFIAELGVSQSQFERFFGIAKGTIKQIQVGNCQLPAKHWHIVYEKIKPAYGVGHYTIEGKNKSAEPEPAAPEKEIDLTLLNQLKNKINGGG